MRKQIGWLWIVGFGGVFAAANAQPPPTYTSRKGQTAPCPARRAGPLHIINGEARYTTATGLRVRGTVGPQGELAMRAAAPSKWANQPIDLSVSGAVDISGTLRVRQLSHSCSYDFVWQKAGR